MEANEKQKKWTKAQIKKEIQNIQEKIDEIQRENKEEHFVAITPEQIEKKLKRVNSPFIISQQWSSATPGGKVIYHLGIYNPDPMPVSELFVYVWVGAGNVDPTVSTFLQNVDMRFPRLTEPSAVGLVVPAAAHAILSFGISVPATIERTNYMGNSCLMQFNWYDVGQYLDRSVFVFTVY